MVLVSEWVGSCQRDPPPGLRPRIALCTAPRPPKAAEIIFFTAEGGRKILSFWPPEAAKKLFCAHARTHIFAPTPYRLQGALPPPDPPAGWLGWDGQPPVGGRCSSPVWADVCRRGWVDVCRAPAPRVAGGCCCRGGTRRPLAAWYTRRAIGAAAPAPHAIF